MSRTSTNESAPARPERLVAEFYATPEALAIHKRKAGGPAVFLLLWLIGWTVGCVWLMAEFIRNPSLGTFAFGVPFWASWLFVAGMVVWMQFGRETMLLRRDQAMFVRQAIVTISTRAVPRHEIRSFRECRSSFQENEQYLWGIEMVTLGKPLKFAFRLPDAERAWLIHQLNGFLASSGSGAALGASTEPADREPRQDSSSEDAEAAPRIKADASDRGENDRLLVEKLDLDRTLDAPPSDSRWQMADAFDEFQFASRGRWQPGAIAGLLFINAFWNGIVSVFVLGLFGFMPGNNLQGDWEWWGLFVFLIPFEAIGLLMFAGLVWTLLEPFRRTHWTFRRREVARTSQWPLYRRAKTWDVLELDRLELRRQRSKYSKFVRLTATTSEPDGNAPFELVVVTDENVELCAIGDLTEGEARWMAHEILTRRPRWFDASARYIARRGRE